MCMSENELSPARKRWLREQKREKTLIAVTKAAILAVFLIVWELAAYFGLIDPFIISCPSRFTKSIINLFLRGELFYHTAVTTFEAVAGFCCGTVIGTLIAVVLWCSRFLCRVLEPYLVILNALPKIALGPVFIVWIGAGMSSIIVIAVCVSLVVSVLEVLGGFLSTDEEMLRLVRSFGANRMQLLQKVVLPANIPTIVGSLKVNVGMSWVGVIVGEFLISKAGLGYLIVYGSQVFQLDLVMASVVILSVVAGGMYLCIEWIERLLAYKR